MADLPGTTSFFWLLPKVLWQSRNDLLCRLRDPTNEQRRVWMRRRAAAAATEDDCVIARPNFDRFTFLLFGDSGEGDHSQYALVPPLRSLAKNAQFALICSDVIYPAGGIEDYQPKFHHPYSTVELPIYAVPGNHDWYDELQGFMYHFCGESPSRPKGGKSRWAWIDPREYLRLPFWRRYHPPDAAERAKLATSSIPSPGQPGPYFAIDTPNLRIVGIDTGIRNSIDRDQAAWLRRVSEGSKPKLLFTGKPLCVDGRLEPGVIEGASRGQPYRSVHDIFADPDHNYVATIGGDIHNYQHYPIRRPDGRLIHYIVSGGGGAFTHATFRLPSMEAGIPGLGKLEDGERSGEDAFRCYPLRGDSLALYSRLWDQRFFGLGRYEIEPAIASRLVSEKRGIPVTRGPDLDAAEAMLHFEERLKRGRRAYRRVTRLPFMLGAGPILSHFYSEFFDWDRPPFFKHLLRLDVDRNALRIRCHAATGWRDDEDDPPVEDDFAIPLLG
jgi:hypothetical protein